MTIVKDFQLNTQFDIIELFGVFWQLNHVYTSLITSLMDMCLHFSQIFCFSFLLNDENLLKTIIFVCFHILYFSVLVLIIEIIVMNILFHWQSFEYSFLYLSYLGKTKSFKKKRFRISCFLLFLIRFSLRLIGLVWKFS